MSFYNLLYASNVQIGTHFDDVFPGDQQAGMTGLLVFSDDRVVQTLEGERGAVQAMFQRIQLDKRHTHVQLLAAQFSTARRFKHNHTMYVGNDAALRQRFGQTETAKLTDSTLCDFMMQLAHADAATESA
jgi:hypothetical protein